MAEDLELIAALDQRTWSLEPGAWSLTVIPRQAQRCRGRRQKETPFHDGRATQLER